MCVNHLSSNGVHCILHNLSLHLSLFFSPFSLLSPSHSVSVFLISLFVLSLLSLSLCFSVPLSLVLSPSFPSLPKMKDDISSFPLVRQADVLGG